MNKNQTGIINIVIAFIVVLVLNGVGYYLFTKNFGLVIIQRASNITPQEPGSYQNPAIPRQIANETTGWETYSAALNLGGDKFEINYPPDWVIQSTRDQTILKIVGSDSQNVGDPGKFQNTFIIHGASATNCKEADWALGLGSFYYKTVCIENAGVKIVMSAVSKDIEKIEDQILSTFKFTK